MNLPQINPAVPLSSRWWGWGDDRASFGLNDHPGIRKHLAQKFGVRTLRAPHEFRIEDIVLAPSRLTEAACARFREIIGKDHVLLDKETRIRHALGKSYRDLARIRAAAVSGVTLPAPDGILLPGSAEEIAALMSACREFGVAIVPFGGGSSVVGGVEPLRGKFDSVIALSLRRLNQVGQVDPVSRTAEIGAGCSGPELEKKLNSQGYLLGHFPQSFEFSTLGGWLAARSSGQNSLGYGSAEKMVVSLRAVTPQGEIRTIEAPNYACGPDWRQVLIGSEGVLGVITSATMRVRPLPEARDYFMVAFPGFQATAEAARKLVQDGPVPSLIRVSDEVESSVMLKFRDDGSLKSRLGHQYLKLRGLPPEGPFSFLLIGFEGKRSWVTNSARAAKRRVSEAGAVMLGRSPGRRWLAERFRLPYLRDEFMNQNLFLETLETVTEWSNLHRLHSAVRDALSGSFATRNLPCDVFCHISHLYPDGASLYFTVLGNAAEDPESQWLDLKRIANQAIVAAGGAISHHHGIGTDHRNHLDWGAVGSSMARHLKQSVDPEGLLNPGKLIPPGDS